MNNKLIQQDPTRFYIWSDAGCYFYIPDFPTLADALTYAERWQHPTHAKRIYHRDAQIATVLPLSISNRHTWSRTHA